MSQTEQRTIAHYDVREHVRGTLTTEEWKKGSAVVFGGWRGARFAVSSPVREDESGNVK